MKTLKLADLADAVVAANRDINSNVHVAVTIDELIGDDRLTLLVPNDWTKDAPDLIRGALTLFAHADRVETEDGRILKAKDAPADPPPPPGFDWIYVEIFGHRFHYGRGREEERFGSKVLRIDIPVFKARDDAEPAEWDTCFYAGTAIFSIRFTTQEAVYGHAKRNMPRPIPAPTSTDDIEDAPAEAEDEPEEYGGHVVY